MDHLEISRQAGQNIRRLLAARQWTQKRLAEETGIIPAQISLLISGKAATSLATLARIADALGVEFRSLLDGPPVPVYNESAVPCGPLAELAAQEPDEWLHFGQMFGPPEGLFVMRSRGESMLGAGVLPGDQLVFRRQTTADPGEKVLARIEGRHTLKMLAKERGRLVLKPAGEGKPIPFDEVNGAIDGVLVGLIRRKM
jgi:SOS-response transcriptional repressor LexA